MVDSIITWARDYKVDGFRFDVMDHHMKRNMEKVRAALDELEEGPDGVDGEDVYVYGEGWNFGEVANGARGENAIQASMAGTGIGTFNDRIRDAARGGGPFSGLQEQGFLTGLYVDPNATDQGSLDQQLDKLLQHQDQIRVGLAGNLADYTFVDRNGETVTGSQVDYNGQPAGYTADPQETINYVAAHDNETLFDAIQLKAPLATSAADRARIQNLGQSLVLLGQGIPFIHAGMEAMRSKSLDRDSFNSGDWFNRVDWSFTENAWGSGLPVASKNLDNWPLFAPLLADPALQVGPGDIRSSVAHHDEMLSIRRMSELFRLSSAEEVQATVKFLNTGPSQVPGVIAMLLDDQLDVDPNRDALLVIWNASPFPMALSPFTVPTTGPDPGWRLHPVQQNSADAIVRGANYDFGTFLVPGRTTAVFELGDSTDVCTPGDTTLCLGENDRFRVEVDWRDFDDRTGSGQAVEIGRRDTGLFWFFDEDNLEITVKVLDACGSEFDSFWVFFAGITNVEYTMTVTDTQTGEVQVYENELGEVGLPVLDTKAFKTCGG